MRNSRWVTAVFVFSSVASASADEVRLSDAELDWVIAGQWLTRVSIGEMPDLGVWSRNPAFSPLPNTPETQIPGNQLQFWPYLGTPFLDTQLRFGICLDAPGYRCGAPYDRPSAKLAGLER